MLDEKYESDFYFFKNWKIFWIIPIDNILNWIYLRAIKVLRWDIGLEFSTVIFTLGGLHMDSSPEFHMIKLFNWEYFQ